jgi:hypothetical protein
VSKKLEKIVEDKVRSQNQCMGDLSVILYVFKEEIVFKNHQIKSNHRVLKKKFE